MPTEVQRPSLLDLVGQDHNEALLLQALLADPGTVRLLAAWRRSVVNLEAARAAAAAAGHEDLVRWLDRWRIRVGPDGWVTWRDDCNRDNGDSRRCERCGRRRAEVRLCGGRRPLSGMRAWNRNRAIGRKPRLPCGRSGVDLCWRAGRLDTGRTVPRTGRDGVACRLSDIDQSFSRRAPRIRRQLPGSLRRDAQRAERLWRHRRRRQFRVDWRRAGGRQLLRTSLRAALITVESSTLASDRLGGRDPTSRCGCRKQPLNAVRTRRRQLMARRAIQHDR